MSRTGIPKFIIELVDKCIVREVIQFELDESRSEVNSADGSFLDLGIHN